MNTTVNPALTGSAVSVGERSKPFDLSMSRDLARIRSEYVEMPGLVLTLPQAARFWGLSAPRAADLLSVLVDAGFLVCVKQTLYRRRR